MPTLKNKHFEIYFRMIQKIYENLMVIMSIYFDVI